MTPTEIEDRFEEAVRTLRRLPDRRPRGHFNTWPAIARTAWEVMAMEKEPMRLWASPEAITCMEQCFEWMLWLEPEDAKIVWMRAENHSFRRIARQFGMSRMMAWRKWATALVVIANRLNMARMAGATKCPSHHHDVPTPSNAQPVRSNASPNTGQ